VNYLPLALATALLVTTPALAENYTEVIPAMGPALLPAVGNILRAQVVDHDGVVDWVFKEFGQNWMCLGTNGDENDFTNYPAVAIYNAGPQPNGFHSGNNVGVVNPNLIPEVAQVQVAKPVDWPSCGLDGGLCRALYTSLQPPKIHSTVKAGDVLVWAVQRRGNNCPGGAYMHDPKTAYPAAPGGEITLGIHVTATIPDP